MKSNKTRVLNFIDGFDFFQDANGIHGLTTQYLSEKLEMQRSNMSKILNELVEEKRLLKKDGRPVHYYSKKLGLQDDSCFNTVIGKQGSLKKAIQLAKAAILYPKGGLPSLIIGENGVGKNYFAKKMYQFAIESEIITKSAPFVKINCKHYSEESDKAIEQLFFTNEDSFFSIAKTGVLFIEHVGCLSNNAKHFLLTFLDQYVNARIDNNQIIIICSISDVENKQLIDTFIEKIPIHINIPNLASRPLYERFEMTSKLLKEEAAKTERTLVIDDEVMRCLLLYDCEKSIKQLKMDIQIGCANAYVREFNETPEKLALQISDFQPYVGKGILHYKYIKAEIDSIVPMMQRYEFSEDTIEIKGEKTTRSSNYKNIYRNINNKVKSLRERNIAEHDINVIVSADVENEVQKYMNMLAEQNLQTEQLSKIVDKRVIELVTEMLDIASKKFNRIFPTTILYGLCLHLNEIIKTQKLKQQLTNEQITNIVKKYKQEYQFCLSFSEKIDQTFSLQLPIDEVVLMTMYISGKATMNENIRKPVVLIAMHGNGTASAIANVINDLVKSGNTYAFDLSLDSLPATAYESFKNYIISINRGQGVLLIYDMGSLKTMATMISNETAIPIKMIEVPITLIGIAGSRKAQMEEDINIVYDSILEDYQQMQSQFKPLYHSSQNRKLIITLCMTGKGAAVQIQNYIKQYVDLEGIDVLSLSISDHTFLLKEVNQLSKKYDILCIVGTYDPELFGIAFVGVDTLFKTEKQQLKEILLIPEKTVIKQSSYEDIFSYLAEQLQHVNVQKLEPLLIEFIQTILERYQLEEDQEIGLLIHIATSIERMITKQESVLHPNKEAILTTFSETKDYLEAKLTKIEQTFMISFGEDELAFIITAIKKI